MKKLKRSTKAEPMTFRLPKSLAKRLRAEAKRRKETLTSVAEGILAKYL